MQSPVPIPSQAVTAPRCPRIQQLQASAAPSQTALKSERWHKALVLPTPIMQTQSNQTVASASNPAPLRKKPLSPYASGRSGGAQPLAARKTKAGCRAGFGAGGLLPCQPTTSQCNFSPQQEWGWAPSNSWWCGGPDPQAPGGARLPNQFPAVGPCPARRGGLAQEALPSPPGAGDSAGAGPRMTR